MSSISPADLIVAARRAKSLTQRELARRAGTSQSVVARIESGSTSPSWNTLTHLLSCAGYSLRAHLEDSSPGRSHMLEDVPRILRLTPEQRLTELKNAARLFAVARRVP